MTPPEGVGPGADLVRLIEVDGYAQPSAPERRDDGLSTGILQRWGWWRSARRRARAVAALAAVGMVIAVGSSVLAATAARPVVEKVRTVAAPVPVAGVDARGCPVGATCVVRASPAVAAVRRASFTHARGVDVYDTAHPGKPVARYLSASRGTNRLRVEATCDTRRAPAAVDEPPRTGAAVLYRLAPPATGTDTALATDYYTRRDTFSCTVQVTCTYPVLASLAGLENIIDRCAVDVQRLGMDAAVYL